MPAGCSRNKASAGARTSVSNKKLNSALQGAIALALLWQPRALAVRANPGPFLVCTQQTSITSKLSTTVNFCKQ